MLCIAIKPRWRRHHIKSGGTQCRKSTKNRLQDTSLRLVENFLKKSWQEACTEYIYIILAASNRADGSPTGCEKYL